MGRKGPVSLDSLSKEELTAKCKQLLQLAQKAKQAKDGNEYNFFGVGSIIKKNTISMATLQRHFSIGLSCYLGKTLGRKIVILS